MNYICNQEPNDIMKVTGWERNLLCFYVQEHKDHASVIIDVDQARHLRDSLTAWLEGDDI